MNFANKLQTMIDAYCMVMTNENSAKQWGRIKAITRTISADTLEDTIDRSEFKVELQSGDVVIVSGRQIIDIKHDYSKAGCVIVYRSLIRARSAHSDALDELPSLNNVDLLAGVPCHSLSLGASKFVDGAYQGLKFFCIRLVQR